MLRHAAEAFRRAATQLGHFWTLQLEKNTPELLPTVPQPTIPKFSPIADVALKGLLEEQHAAELRAFHEQEERKVRVAQLRLDLIRNEHITSQEEFDARKARWCELIAAEKSISKFSEKDMPDLRKSASKWNPEVLGKYIPSMSVRHWNASAVLADRVWTKSLEDFLSIHGSDSQNLEAPVDMQVPLDFKTNQLANYLATELRPRINESLAACGLQDGISELDGSDGSTEAVSRLVIDAVLLGLCSHNGIQIRLEQQLGSSTSSVSSRADYTICRQLQMQGKPGRQKALGNEDIFEVVGVVEAKKCDEKWPRLLAQACIQAAIQLVCLSAEQKPQAPSSWNVSEDFTKPGLLALASDGRRWIALELTRADLSILLWPRVDTTPRHVAVLDLARDGDLEALCVCLAQHFMLDSTSQ